MQTTVKWVEALAFDAVADSGHIARLDTTVEGGGLNSGMSPKRMLLASVCGCTGIDVVEMLQKMRVIFSKLEIHAEAEQTEDVPKVFTHINLTYRINAAAEDLDKVKRAVELSQEKYCGVSIMIKKHCPVNYTIELI